MFKKHPKGLLPSAMANMGERFGFYTMMGILVLFIMAKFGLSENKAILIYSIFYFFTYAFALIGGIIADRTRRYKATISTGIVLMVFGYAIIAIPTPTPVPNLAIFLTLTCLGLFVIAFGNGLFKGNLQALLGQMYDNDKYSKLRDSGFSIFYMFINIGAIFAPIAAVQVRNWWLKSHGFSYNSGLPELCHGHLNNTLKPEATERFGRLAKEVSGSVEVTDLTEFANRYLDLFSTGFHYAFLLAIVSLLFSLVVFWRSRKSIPDPKPVVLKEEKNVDKTEVAMELKEVKQRIYALLAIYFVVIFFWFSFNQSGASLTLFAKDYTLLKIGSWNISAEIFQSMNPFFVVFLTPIVLAFFGWLRSKGIEPSTPKKIAIGMGIAAGAYLVMMLGAMHLPSAVDVKAAGGLEDPLRVTPFLLISVYLILTIAELFISPLGLSFVSKVAPPQYQGLMQGGWLCATAIGSLLLPIGGLLYTTSSQSITWAVFVTVCLCSMILMLVMIKWLERVSK